MREALRHEGRKAWKRAACGLAHAVRLIFVTVFALSFIPSALAQLAVRGQTVYTMAGAPISDGLVIITDGRIAAVGPADEVDIPEGYEVIEAQVVTPGLIDAYGTVGLTGIYNQPHDQDQIERSSAMQPELRAIDAYNVREELVAYVRGFGVTTVHTGHAPGELITGQTMIVKTVGNTVEQAIVREPVAVISTLGPRANRSEGSPGTRGKQMSLLRQELIKAREYLAGDGRARFDADPRDDDSDDEDDDDDDLKNGERRAADRGDSRRSRGRDLHLETLGHVLEGDLPLIITANKAQDISSALRLAEEFNIRIWLSGAAESYLLIDEIKAAGVPVIIHPTMTRANREYENLSFETASNLVKAGIPVAMQSGFEGYVPKVRVVLFEAAITAAFGLSFEQALALITRDAARILGIEDRVGTIEVGKDGDVALYNGDPFEYTTHCIGVIIDGVLVSDEPQ
jgi:imidazolonepropionase-like amidohydrolase